MDLFMNPHFWILHDCEFIFWRDILYLFWDSGSVSTFLFPFLLFWFVRFYLAPRKSNAPMLIKMKCSSKRNCHPVYRLTDKILEYQIFILNIKALVGMIHSDRCIEKCYQYLISVYLHFFHINIFFIQYVH